MNKRELRKIPWLYAKKRWSQQAALLEEGLASEYYPKNCFLVTAERYRIDGQCTLIVTFYDCKQLAKGNLSPLFRLMQGRKEYVNEDFEPKGKGKWRSRSIESFCKYGINKIIVANKGSEKIIQSYCRHSAATPIASLKQLQRKIMDERLCRKHDIIRRQIQNELAGFPSEPADYRQWIANTVLPSYIFYTYTRKKWKKGYCTHCKKEIQVSDARHNRESHCPNCGHSIIYKAQGRKDWQWDHVNTAFIGKNTRGEVVVEYADVYRSFREAGQQERFSVYPVFRNIYSGAELKTAYIMRGTEWRRKREGIVYYGNYSHCYNEAYLYPKNLKNVLQNTPWEFSGISQFAEQNRKMYLYDQLKGYPQYPQAEYLVKKGLYNLAECLLLGNERYFDLTKKQICPFLKLQSTRYLPTLIQMDASLEELDFIQKLELLGNRVRGGIVQPEHIREFCKGNAKRLYDPFILLKDATAHKILKYIKKVDVSIWEDYLRFCRQLNRDLRNEFVMFPEPKKLKERHDELMELCKLQRKRDNDDYIKSKYKMEKDIWSWQNESFHIRLPRNTEEIIEEGDKQKHCVGMYIDRVCNGKCVILFLRKNDAPNQPFYTVEYARGEIQQYRGFANKPIEGYHVQAKQFLEQYQITIRKRLYEENAKKRMVA